MSSYHGILQSGPVRFPCAVCHLPVWSSQHALLCDECGLWCHCTFCGVDKGWYQSYLSLSFLLGSIHIVWANVYPFMITHYCVLLMWNIATIHLRSLVFLQVVLQLRSLVFTFLLHYPLHIHFRMAHLNCRSLLAHLDDVLLFIQIKSQYWHYDTIWNMAGWHYIWFGGLPSSWTFLEKTETIEEVVLLLYFLIMFAIVPVLIYLKEMLSHFGWNQILCILLFNIKIISYNKF